MKGNNEIKNVRNTLTLGCFHDGHGDPRLGDLPFLGNDGENKDTWHYIQTHGRETAQIPDVHWKRGSNVGWVEDMTGENL